MKTLKIKFKIKIKKFVKLYNERNPQTEQKIYLK